MRDPLWRIKTLPWLPLVQNALLTVVLATILDIALQALLVVSFQALPAGSGAGLQGGIVQVLLQFMAAGGVGALAVILLERIFRNVVISTAVLWALVGCLALVLFLKSLLSIPTLLVGFSYLQFVGLIFGLFSQGRRYWRY